MNPAGAVAHYDEGLLAVEGDGVEQPHLGGDDDEDGGNVVELAQYCDADGDNDDNEGDVVEQPHHSDDDDKGQPWC